MEGNSTRALQWIAYGHRDEDGFIAESCASQLAKFAMISTSTKNQTAMQLMRSQNRCCRSGYRAGRVGRIRCDKRPGL